MGVRAIIILSTAGIAAALGAKVLVIDNLDLLNGVVWNLVGIFAGVGLAAAVFVLSALNSIRDRAIRALDGNEKLCENAKGFLAGKFDAAARELRGDVRVIILVALSVLIIMGWGHSDLPGISWPVWFPLTKIQAIYGLSFWLICVLLHAVWDTVETMFVLHQIEGNVRDSRGSS